MNLSDWFSERMETNQLEERHELFINTLQSHVEKCLYSEEVNALTNLKQEVKDGMIESLYQLINDIRSSEDPVLESRKTIAFFVDSLAAYNVLTMSAEDESHMKHYSNVPWISGELHNYLPDMTKYFNELDEDIRELEITDEQLMGYCNQMEAVKLYYLNALNYLRCIIFDDVTADEDKDWFRPFLTATMIRWESIFRSEGKLDNLGLDSADSLIYERFFDLVEISVNPYADFDSEWKDHMKKNGTPDKSHYLQLYV